VQTHIVIDRFMNGHELRPGERKEVEMLVDEIAAFRELGRPNRGVYTSGPLAGHPSSRYTFVVNRKMARAMGVEVPLGVLARRRRGDRVKRRPFMAALGGAAVWPVVARAQGPARPVIGYLSPQSFDEAANDLSAFRQGLKETGYVEGENVTVEYRFADNQVDRLSAMAARLRPAVVQLVVVASSRPAPATSHRFPYSHAGLSRLAGLCAL
jgi:hypothetical protein